MTKEQNTNAFKKTLFGFPDTKKNKSKTLFLVQNVDFLIGLIIKKECFLPFIIEEIL